MHAVQGYLEKLGGNFMIAAFIPSLAFILACLTAFQPLIPTALFERMQNSLSPVGESGLVALLVAIMMGFTLTSLNTYVYRLFEGYVLYDLLIPFRKLELKRARRIRSKLDLVHKKIDQLEAGIENWKKARMPKYNAGRLERIERRIINLKAQRDALTADYDLRYPPDESLILPTRFGNILRAAEAYSQSRYQIDSVPLWPRLVYAMDEKYMGHVDTANDQCSFLLNSSLLSAIFAVLSFFASSYQFFLLYGLFYGISGIVNITSPANPDVYIQRIFGYFMAGVFALGIAWFFYSASLLNVTKYGNLIRSSYDLFRFNLLDRLHLKLPPNIQKERRLWENVSEFITIGDAVAPHLSVEWSRKSLQKWGSLAESWDFSSARDTNEPTRVILP